MTQRLLFRLRVAFLIAGCGLVLALAMAWASPARATVAPQATAQPQEKPSNDFCLGCHSKEGMTRTLSSGQTLSLTIDQEAFKHSVHNDENVACVDCHAPHVCPSSPRCIRI